MYKNQIYPFSSNDHLISLVISLTTRWSINCPRRQFCPMNVRTIRLIEHVEWPNETRQAMRSTTFSRATVRKWIRRVEGGEVLDGTRYRSGFMESRVESGITRLYSRAFSFWKEKFLRKRELERERVGKTNFTILLRRKHSSASSKRIFTISLMIFHQKWRIRDKSC